MGTELSQTMAPSETDIPVVPWLDDRTAGLVRAIVATAARRHPDLRAAILYGSVARHDEHSLEDAEPSDVDLLLVFDLERELDRLPRERTIAVFDSVGLARDRYLYTPREVQVMLAVRDLADWDPTFVANVAREGLLLWSRGALPSPLAGIEMRSPLRPPAA